MNNRCELILVQRLWCVNLNDVIMDEGLIVVYLAYKIPRTSWLFQSNVYDFFITDILNWNLILFVRILLQWEVLPAFIFVMNHCWKKPTLRGLEPPISSSGGWRLIH